MGIKELARSLTRHSRVGLDTNILIYHLEDIPHYAELTNLIFEQIGEGDLTAVLSVLSVTELMVTPYQQKSTHRIQQIEQFVHTFPSLELQPITYTIAKEAARLRATCGWKTPDALLFATALVEKADLFITNDDQFQKCREEKIQVLTLHSFTT